MFSNEIADQIMGRLSVRFDGIPRATLRSVIRETLVARETFHTDATHARFDGDDTPAPKTVPKDRRADMADSITNMWKRGAQV